MVNGDFFKMNDKIDTIADNVDNREKHAVDLDQALAVAGVGWYNIKFCLVLALFLIAAIVEPVGYSFVIPAAICDLEISSAQRGFLSSVPYIGIVLTSFPWGYLVDTRGRKRMVICSSLAAGTFGILSGFMPEFISFTICKFLASVCIACPAAVPYTFIGEIMPKRHRDLALSITNAMQISGGALVPLLAWAILPLDFRIDFGAYYFRPWRLLAMANSCFFIIAAVLMSFGPESPKYLVSQGKHDEAIKILQNIYSRNKGKSPDDYPIKSLKSIYNTRKKESFLNSLKVQTIPLLKPPYLKWLALNGFLLFGMFAILNGLVMWVPDILNRVLTGSDTDGMTACEVIAQRLNESSAEDAECVDTIDPITYFISSLANISCALVALAVGSLVKFIGKKRLLVILFLVIGTFCILINIITKDLVFAILMSTFQVMALGVGPVNAYSVEIFPTHLRGMAVGLSMMIGRCGSIIGTNVAGLLLNTKCEATFYLFGGLLLLCCMLTFLLPNSKGTQMKLHKSKTITRL